MRWEDFFEFQAHDEVKLKGHRIWLHHVVEMYLSGLTDVKQLRDWYPDLDESAVLACLLYYSLHREQVDNYLASMREHAEEMRAKQRIELAPLIERMNALAEVRKQEAVAL